jgi:PIN domain nuclease of toxin-antitoxin system
MKLLLDTRSILWMLDEPHRLSSIAQDTIDDTDNELFYSTMSILEIAIKVRIGKLKTPDRLLERLAHLDCKALPVSTEHAWHVASLPLIHRDPFDRVIVAQAIVERLVLVTSDHLLPRYPCIVLRA